MKEVRTIIVLVILAAIGLGAFRAAQVISAKKEGRHAGRDQLPLVEAAPVTQGPVEEKILRTGDIAPETQVTIYSKVQGWVEKINVREGDPVASGQVLATLDAREAEAAVAQSRANREAAAARLKQVRAIAEETAQAQIQQAKANRELAEADLRRFRELHEKNFISRQQLDEARTKFDVAKANHDLALNSIRQKTWENDIALAEAQLRQAQANLDLSRAQLANLIITSPLNGGVTKRFVDPGTMVKDTTPILTLMALGRMKMVVNVIEREFIHLRKGQPVHVSVTAFPDRTFTGRIEIINPALELQSRTAEIQISIPNPGFLLKPGMFGRAEIILRSNPQAILVPLQSVVSQAGKEYVFVLKDGKAFRREVRKGLARDADAEILSGLTPGEQIVITGHGSLNEGTRVRLSSPDGK
ncbi:MAG: efflux RND transporter periplasmic adaptor subunit [Syntrophales bacterium]